MVSYGFPVVFPASFSMLFRSFLHGFPMVPMPGDRLHRGVTGLVLVFLWFPIVLLFFSQLVFLCFSDFFAWFSYGFHTRRPVTPRCNRSLASFPMVSYGFPLVFPAGFPMLFRSFLHGFPMVPMPGDRLHRGVTGLLLVFLWFPMVFLLFSQLVSDAVPKFFARFSYGSHARRPVTPKCNRFPAGFSMVSYGFPVVFPAGFPMLFRSFLHGFHMVSIPGDRLHPGVTGLLLVFLWFPMVFLLFSLLVFLCFSEVFCMVFIWFPCQETGYTQV